MQIGLMLPSFSERADPAIETALHAEAEGLHGVFCYDHLWPMGEPGAPAISPYPLLAAIAEVTERVGLGTLVARVGLEPDAVLASKLETLAALAPGRTIAGLGTGDRHSDEENKAFGIAHRRPEDRRSSLESVARALSGAPIEIWVGGGSRRTNELARRLGGTLNLWDVAIEQVAAAALEGPVSWGGPLGRDPDLAADRMAALARAGATWAVFATRRGVEPVVDAARRAGLELAS